jgi:outer membrane usher protein
MLRQGRVKYSLNAGRYHSGTDDQRTPDFLEGSFFYGLPAQMTLYGGVRAADNYQALALGLGRGFGVFGSLGIDDTLAKSRLPNGERAVGQAWRVQYQKDFTTTGTALSLSSYRYASRNYYEFSALNESDSTELRINNRRSRSQLTVTQALGSMGSLSISAWMQDYWHTGGEDKTIHLGWYSSWRGISWGAGYYYTDSALEKRPERTVSFNINIPLGKWLPDSSVSYFINQNNRGNTTQQMSLNGTALAQRNLNYSIQQSLSNNGQNDSTSLAMQYSGGYGNASLGYDHSRTGDNASLGLSGGIVATQYGVTLSQPLGDTIALLRIPGAPNVEPEGYDSVHTDSRGYAVMPAVSPYHKNTLNLKTDTLGENADVEQSGVTVVPTSGAVVLADYKTHIGYRVLFSVRYQGAPVPFGAQAEVVELKKSTAGDQGMVADNGLAYLSGVPERGTLRVNWSQDGEQHQCQTPFKLGAAHMAPGVATLTVECH